MALTAVLQVQTISLCTHLCIYTQIHGKRNFQSSTCRLKRMSTYNFTSFCEIYPQFRFPSFRVLSIVHSPLFEHVTSFISLWGKWVDSCLNSVPPLWTEQKPPEFILGHLTVLISSFSGKAGHPLSLSGVAPGETSHLLAA